MKHLYGVTFAIRLQVRKNKMEKITVEEAVKRYGNWKWGKHTQTGKFFIECYAKEMHFNDMRIEEKENEVALFFREYGTSPSMILIPNDFEYRHYTEEKSAEPEKYIQNNEVTAAKIEELKNSLLQLDAALELSPLRKAITFIRDGFFIVSHDNFNDWYDIVRLTADGGLGRKGESFQPVTQVNVFIAEWEEQEDFHKQWIWKAL